MSERINEAIQVEGAQHIGNDDKFDAFEILTFNAAQNFVVGNTTVPAGTHWVSNEQTFNRNVNNITHLYFFTLINTNKVVLAVVCGGGIKRNIIIESEIKNNNISFMSNFYVENVNLRNYIEKDNYVPLYLIPECTVSGLNKEKDGIVILNEELIAILKCFTPKTVIQELDLREFKLNGIENSPFIFGVSVKNIIIPNSIYYIDYNGMANVTDQINIISDKDNDLWDKYWNYGKKEITNYNYGASPEELAKIKAEKEAEEERIRKEKEKEKLDKINKEIAKLRYRVVGKEIHICGTFSNVTEIIIPEEIDNKPVTTIDAYSFYKNQNLERIRIPASVNKIERYAFAFCKSLTTCFIVNKNCFIGKDAFYGSDIPDLSW